MTFTTVFYAFLVGLLPALVWLYFWLKEDNLHPEPKGVLALCFVAGCISVVAAIILENYTQHIFTDPSYKYAVWAGIEEILKFACVAILVFHTAVLDEPIDAMIYCITVALGFAALENILFILNPLHHGEVSAGIITGNLRFMGATLVHVVSSAVIGFMVALSFYKSLATKTIFMVVGIILAIALHTSFNLAIMYVTPNDMLKVFGWVWVAVTILILLFEEVKAVRPKLLE